MDEKSNRVFLEQAFLLFNFTRKSAVADIPPAEMQNSKYVTTEAYAP